MLAITKPQQPTFQESARSPFHHPSSKPGHIVQRTLLATELHTAEHNRPHLVPTGKKNNGSSNTSQKITPTLIPEYKQPRRTRHPSGRTGRVVSLFPRDVMFQSGQCENNGHCAAAPPKMAKPLPKNSLPRDIVGVRKDQVQPLPMREFQLMIGRGREALVMKPPINNGGVFQMQPPQPGFISINGIKQHLLMQNHRQALAGMKHKFSSTTYFFSNNDNNSTGGGGHDGQCCRCGWESSNKCKESPINGANAINEQDENDDGFEDGAGGASGNASSVDDEYLVFSIEI